MSPDGHPTRRRTRVVDKDTAERWVDHILFLARVGVRVELCLEVDHGSDGRWSHFSMHHDTEIYSRRQAELLTELSNNFHMLLNPAGPVLAEHRRLGAFEVWAVVTIAPLRLAPILLHSKLNTSLFPSVAGLVRRFEAVLGLAPARSPVPSTFQQCARCGSVVARCHRVVERFSHAAGPYDRPLDGTNYPAALNYKVEARVYANGLTRYGQRMLCDGCCQLCAHCGHRFVPTANYPHACLGCPKLPYGAEPFGTSVALCNASGEIRHVRSGGWPDPFPDGTHGNWPGPTLVSEYSYVEKPVYEYACHDAKVYADVVLLLKLEGPPADDAADAADGSPPSGRFTVWAQPFSALEPLVVLSPDKPGTAKCVFCAAAAGCHPSCTHAPPSAPVMALEEMQQHLRPRSAPITLAELAASGLVMRPLRMHCPLEYTFHLEPIAGDEAAARAQLPTSEMLASGGVGTSGALSPNLPYRTVASEVVHVGETAPAIVVIRLRRIERDASPPTAVTAGHV